MTLWLESRRSRGRLSSQQWFLVLAVWVCLILHILSVVDGSAPSASSSSATGTGLIPLLIHGRDDEVQSDRPTVGPLFPFGNQARDWVHAISRRGPATLARSIPALSVYSVRTDDDDGDDRRRRRRRRNRHHHHHYHDHPRRNDRDVITEVAVKQKTRPRPRRPDVHLPSPEDVRAMFLNGNGGFYYGIDPKSLADVTTKNGQSTGKGGTKRQRQRPPRLTDSMNEALEELRMMRVEMENMRKEMQILKRKMIGDDGGEEAEDETSDEEAKGRLLQLRRKKQKEAEKLAKEIESWAHTMLQEGEDEGWKPVECNKMVRGTLNEHGRTTAYIKWMKDSRQSQAVPDDHNYYPCIKCYATIDAPLEDVCTYLSQENASADYNDVVEKHKDIEEISPGAKICWSQSPQILFIKPRDFVTFCHHRWRSDGTEIIVNQACDHPKYPMEAIEKEGKSCRGYALRGANFLSRSPEDPSKTQISIVAHANPGGGLPQWASKTAVNALAPIEPFKLFHKINENVIRNQPALRERLADAEMVSNLPPGRSPRPAGMAQLGYACFWPNGGGSIEGNLGNDNSQTHPSATLSSSEGQGDGHTTQKVADGNDDVVSTDATGHEAPEMVAPDSS